MCYVDTFLISCPASYLDAGPVPQVRVNFLESHVKRRKWFPLGREVFTAFKLSQTDNTGDSAPSHSLQKASVTVSRYLRIGVHALSFDNPLTGPLCRNSARPRESTVHSPPWQKLTGSGDLRALTSAVMCLFTLPFRPATCG